MARHHGVADGGCALLHLPDCSSLIAKRQLWASRAKCIFPGITQSHLMSYSRVWSCQAWPGKVSRVKMTQCKSDSNLSYRETIWEMNCWAKWHGWDLPVAKSTLCVCHWLYMCVCVWWSVCYLCDSTAESFGQLSNLSLSRLRPLFLFIQLLSLLVVIYLQVLHTQTHTKGNTITHTFFTGYRLNSSVKVNNMNLKYQLHLGFSTDGGEEKKTLDTTQWFFPQS